MSGIEKIPTPSVNGDSGDGIGFGIQQNAGQVDYNKESLDSIIQSIWNDKRGKHNLNYGFGMYFEIPSSGKIDVNQLAADFLREILSSSNSFEWAEDFGRVIVGTCNRKVEDKQLFTLLSKNDTASKTYKTISGGVLINPRDFILVDEQKVGSNLVILNSQPTTIDGLFIALIHMFDQLIWERSLQLCGNRNSYFEAASQILDEGVNLQFCSTDEILLLKARNPEVGVRLYGSKNESVPFVMGCVLNNAFDVKFNLNEVETFQFTSSPSFEKTTAESYEVAIGVTTAKEMHVGHLLLYLIANSFAIATGERVTLIANNMGPRVAEAILTLQNILKEKGVDMTLEEISKLSSILPLIEVQLAYQARSKAEKGKVSKLTAEIAKAEINVLEQATLDNVQILNSLGLDPNVIFDTDASLSKQLETKMKGENGFLPEAGIGFTTLQKGQTITFLENGSPTGIGTEIANLAFLTSLSGGKKGVVYVDGNTATVLGVKIAQEKLGIPAEQIGGAAIGFRGEVASGTKGNSITLREFQGISKKIGDELCIPSELEVPIILKALTFTLFSTYHFAEIVPGSNGSETFLDFADKKSFETFLLQKTAELFKIKKEIAHKFDVLADSDFTNENMNPNAKKALLGKAQALTKLRPISLIQKMTSQKALSVEKDSLLDEIIAHGYSNEEATTILNNVRDGRVVLSSREHNYFEFIAFLRKISIDELKALNQEERDIVIQSILVINKMLP